MIAYDYTFSSAGWKDLFDSNSPTGKWDVYIWVNQGNARIVPDDTTTTGFSLPYRGSSNFLVAPVLHLTLEDQSLWLHGDSSAQIRVLILPKVGTTISTCS